MPITENSDLTVEEVARILQMHPVTVYRKASKEPPEIPGAYRAGTSIRFHRHAFEARLSLEEWRERQRLAS